MYFTGKFGYTLGRKYPIYDKKDRLAWQLSFINFGDERTQLNPEIQNNFFFEVGLAFKVEITD